MTVLPLYAKGSAFHSLYINDYNLDSANSKTNGMVNLVKKVNGGGTRLIDGCGTQMHLNVCYV